MGQLHGCEHFHDVCYLYILEKQFVIHLRGAESEINVLYVLGSNAPFIRINRYFSTTLYIKNKIKFYFTNQLAYELFYYFYILIHSLYI